MLFFREGDRRCFLRVQLAVSLERNPIIQERNQVNNYMGCCAEGSYLHEANIQPCSAQKQLPAMTIIHCVGNFRLGQRWIHFYDCYVGFDTHRPHRLHVREMYTTQRR
jgi:hypothetical protein